MYVCRWHLEIPFGRQAEAVKTMNEWKAEALPSVFQKAKSARLLAGHVGTSASRLIAEYEFETLAEWDQALTGMGDPRFVKYAEALAPLVVAGSQRWEILKVLG